MQDVDLATLLPQVIALAKQAGDAIMQVYNTDFSVIEKADHSPLTQADMAAHHCIEQGLLTIAPHIPVLSEESATISYAERKSWQTYWLVDPLDGTKEFVKRNDEFTVNIALIQGHRAVLGVVYAPVLDVTYYAANTLGAYKQSQSNPAQAIKSRAINPNNICIAGSRSHACAESQRFIQNVSQRLSEPQLISMGSSLKTCLVAEGTADVYPRLGPTSEWDTAAAHCVLSEAGGTVIELSGKELHYNTKESLLNPSFLAIADKQHNWTQYQ